MKTFNLLILCIILSFSAFISCKKDNGTSTTTTPNTTSQLSVALGGTTMPVEPRDAPANPSKVPPVLTHFDHFYLDVQEVKVSSADTADTNESGWSLVPITPVTIDLVSLLSGKDTLLGATVLNPPMTIREVRLILGPNNSVVINGVTYPLKVPSGQQSGFKIKVLESLNMTTLTLILDVNLDASVVSTGDGNYILKPVVIVKAKK
jgi:hypothetical protein